MNILNKVVKLKAAGAHFSCISAYNTEHGFGLVYHFILNNTPIDLKIEFPQNEVVKSIAAIYPSAYKYETEAHEMFGIKFDKLKQTKFYLPDDWPKGVYPLSKHKRSQPPP